MEHHAEYTPIPFDSLINIYVFNSYQNMCVWQILCNYCWVILYKNHMWWFIWSVPDFEDVCYRGPRLRAPFPWSVTECPSATLESSSLCLPRDHASKGPFPDCRWPTVARTRGPVHCQSRELLRCQVLCPSMTAIPPGISLLSGLWVTLPMTASPTCPCLLTLQPFPAKALPLINFLDVYLRVCLSDQNV